MRPASIQSKLRSQVMEHYECSVQTCLPLYQGDIQGIFSELSQLAFVVRAKATFYGPPDFDDTFRARKTKSLKSLSSVRYFHLGWQGVVPRPRYDGVFCTSPPPMTVHGLFPRSLNMVTTALLSFADDCQMGGSEYAPMLRSTEVISRSE